MKVRVFPFLMGFSHPPLSPPPFAALPSPLLRSPHRTGPQIPTNRRRQRGRHRCPGTATSTSFLPHFSAICRRVLFPAVVPSASGADFILFGGMSIGASNPMLGPFRVLTSSLSLSLSLSFLLLTLTLSLTLALSLAYITRTYSRTHPPTYIAPTHPGLPAAYQESAAAGRPRLLQQPAPEASGRLQIR